MKEVIVYAILIMGIAVWFLLIAGGFAYLCTKLSAIYCKWQLDRLIKKELQNDIITRR